MTKHWEKVGPPVYLSVAAYLGMGEKVPVTPTTGSKANANVGDDPADLLNQFRHTGGMIQ